MNYPAPHIDYEFGDTCPVLKVARKHDVDYADALFITDHLIHGAAIPASVLQMPATKFHDLVGDCGKIAMRYQQLVTAVPDPLTAPTRV